MQLSEMNSLEEGSSLKLANKTYMMQKGVLKSKEIIATSSQTQTQNVFSFKWKQEDTFNSPASLARMKSWLLERYQSPEHWLSYVSCDFPIVLDAGCGAGMSGFEYWGEVADKIQYIGVDISEAIDIAKKRSKEKGFENSVFLQESIDDLPFIDSTFDIIFSEGVLHHTDSIENTFNHLCRFLKSGGLFMFYVYQKKGPIREFTDDYIREKLQTLSPQDGWNALQGLTKLGIELGKLDLEINIPEKINFLEIPAGKISLQRLFYWYIFKAFYDPNLSFEEMHHINYDWYAPKNAYRHTVQEIKELCEKNNLQIEYMKEELAGITCIAKKQ